MSVFSFLLGLSFAVAANFAVKYCLYGLATQLALSAIGLWIYGASKTSPRKP